MELALLFKVEFWRVNFWRLLVSPPNPPKYSPTKILRYTVTRLTWSNQKFPRSILQCYC